VHVILARVLPQAMSRRFSNGHVLASLMFSITLGAASIEQVISRVLLSPSLSSGHLGKGVVEGGTRGVFDSSSVFISGE